MDVYVVALDIGGSKAHLVVEALDRQRVVDQQIPSFDWDAEPADKGAAWIDAKLRRHVPSGGSIVSLALGAQGVDSAATAANLTLALAKLGYRATVVNDAALIVPAGGFDQGVGIIAGTGAIGVGKDRAGKMLTAGGWGCVIGDEGGAAALVKEATRAALRAHDEGKPDDGLLGALLGAFGVADAERLARKVNDEPTAENWAPRCPAVFAAADAGSTLAAQVIDEGARALAALVDQLVARGAVGTDVVAAGGVIVNQQRLFAAFARALRASHPELKPHKLAVAPVEGALALAELRRPPEGPIAIANDRRRKVHVRISRLSGASTPRPLGHGRSGDRIEPPFTVTAGLVPRLSGSTKMVATPPAELALVAGLSCLESLFRRTRSCILPALAPPTCSETPGSADRKKSQSIRVIVLHGQASVSTRLSAVQTEPDSRGLVPAIHVFLGDSRVQVLIQVAPFRIGAMDQRVFEARGECNDVAQARNRVADVFTEFGQHEAFEARRVKPSIRRGARCCWTRRKSSRFAGLTNRGKCIGNSR